MNEAPVRPLLEWRSPGRRWLQAWGLSLLVWTALWLYLSVPTMLRLQERHAWERWPYLAAGLTDHTVSAILTPLFLVIVWSLLTERGRWLASLAKLLTAAMAFALLDDVLCQGLRVAGMRLTQTCDLLHHFERVPAAAELYLRTIFNYAQIAAVGWALHYRHEARARELRAVQLEGRLTQARLDALRMQLQPHFLFNTLNTIAALVRRDPIGAERMIARLSELLRHSLASTGTQEVLLREELELVERYVDIERVRFADRLTVMTTAPEETLVALVPSLVLQPIVENAIRYGVASRSAPGRVQVAARRVGDELLLSVSDDGPGLTTARLNDPGSGVGLANTRARLAQLYGGGATLSIASRPAGGTEVTLRMPFRLAEAGGAEQPNGSAPEPAGVQATEPVSLPSSS